MRILLSSHGASPYGAERVLLELVRAFVRAGHDTFLEIPHPGPMLDEARSVQGLQLRESQRARLPRNLREAARYFLTLPWEAVRLARFIRHSQIELVWTNTLFNPIGALAARLSGRPVIWHLHERNLTGVTGWIAATMVGLLATRVIAVSSFAASTYRRGLLKYRTIGIVPNAEFRGLEPRRQPHTTNFVVGCVGQLEVRKRPLDVVKALSMVPADVHALFVGDGKFRRAVEEVVESAGLEDRVKLAGVQQDVGAYYSQMDCIVIPSLEEAFGLVAVEAMAAGCPVIAVRSGALPEVLGDAALYFEPGDVDALAALVSGLQCAQRLRGEMRARGCARSALFAPSVWEQRVLSEAERLNEAGSSSAPSIEPAR